MSKQRLNNLFFFLGLAAVVVMLFTFDVSFVELWEHICHAGYWLIPIVGDLPINTAIATVLGIIILFCLIFFWIFSRGYRKGLVVSTLHLLGRIPGLKGWSSRLLEKRGETFRNIDQQIASLYAEDKRAFYRSLILEYLSRVVQSSEVLFMLLLFGIDCGGGFTGITLTYLHAILSLIHI